MRAKSGAYQAFLITRKALDARRRGATTEAYGQYAARRSDFFPDRGGKTTLPDDAFLVIRKLFCLDKPL
jgi:hypothetical protein